MSHPILALLFKAVCISQLKQGAENLRGSLNKLVWLNECLPDVLHWYAALLARVVIRVTVLRALTYMMAWLLAPLAYVAFGQGLRMVLQN